MRRWRHPGLARLARERAARARPPASSLERAAHLVDELAASYARDAARERSPAAARTWAIAAATARAIADALRASRP